MPGDLYIDHRHQPRPARLGPGARPWILGVVRFPADDFGAPLGQFDEAGVVQRVLDIGEVVVEAFGDQRFGQHEGFSGGLHVVWCEAEGRHSLQQCHRAVGQQGAVTGGEPVEHISLRGQLGDSCGEALFGIGECIGELRGVGVDKRADVGQRHPGGGQCPDLYQPQQFG
ncbi:hypothetical protein [Nocardia grenadensis]|uniref:hypothetical protein n=1 Tax=Nocardia grenadensis TaxID=931537 RepID=UPI0007A412C8|nr:hypothetical protein [Nocardia grenadensis]